MVTAALLVLKPTTTVTSSSSSSHLKLVNPKYISSIEVEEEEAHKLMTMADLD
jgi:hypothetical protein